MHYKFWPMIFWATFALNGCGLSTEDWANQAHKAVSTNSFDIGVAWTNFNLNPNTKEMIVYGSCGGTYIVSNTAVPPPATSVEFANTTIINGLFQVCDPEFKGYEGRQYANVEHKFIYQNSKLLNVEYVYNGLPNIWREPANFPAAAKVGDSGLIGILDNYVKDEQTGSIQKKSVEEWRYSIEAHTATSVIFNLIVKGYATATSSTATDYLDKPVIVTEQLRYVVASDNRMKLYSYELTLPKTTPSAKEFNVRSWEP